MNEEYFWSIVLEPGWVQAGIWTVKDKAAKVISVSPASHWETDEDLAQTVDTSLSAAIQNFPEDAKEPEKTVFGVPPSWVSDGQIKKEHLEKVKSVCTKLSLKPSGFVVLPEAIANAMKLEEGSPLNAVIVGLGEREMDVTLYRLGNMVGTVNVGRSVSVIDDVVEGLARFGTTEALPSRILLYDGRTKELEETRDELSKADWGAKSEKIKFLHPPKIEIIEPKGKTEAVCLAGASEIGGVEKIVKEGELGDTPDHSEAQEMGFVVDKDVAEGHVEMEPDSGDDGNVFEPKRGFFDKIMQTPMLLINKITRILPARGRGPVISHGQPRFQKKVPLALVVAIFSLLLIGGGVAWWVLPKADVSVFVAPQKIEQTEVVQFSLTDNNLDTIGKVIPVKTAEAEVEKSKTKSATGSKVIGDKAKGKVTIRNGTSTNIKLAAGTTLFGPNDLKFELDETASVSAATSPSSPGSQTVNVTAAAIGADYNLAKNESFKVSNFPTSEVDAVVESDLTGGSSKEIVAVSQDDIKSLEEDLTKELADEAKSKFADQIGSDEMLADGVVESDVSDKKFSNKAGDEASNVSLDMTIKATGLVVKKGLMQEFTKSILGDRIPQGFVLRPEQTEYEFTNADKLDDSTWRFNVTFTANLLPDVDPDRIAKSITGKKPQIAKEYLTTVPGYSRSEIKINPAFPGFLSTLPHMTKKITVTISAER